METHTRDWITSEMVKKRQNSVIVDSYENIGIDGVVEEEEEETELEEDEYEGAGEGSGVVDDDEEHC